MENEDQSKEQLMAELTELRRINSDLEEEMQRCIQSEKQYRESADKYARAFRSNPYPITITDLREGYFLEVNDAYLKSTGYERNEIIGRTVHELGIYVLPEQREYIMKQIQGNGIIHDLEMEFRMKSGEVRTVLFSAETIDIGGQECLLAVTEGITERKRAEERLRIKEAELRSIVENANGIIFTISADGFLNFVSRGWTEIMGRDISEIEGHSFECFVHPDDVLKCKRLVNKVMTTGESLKGVEYRVKHIDGSWHWHTASGAPIKDEAGNAMYCVCIAVDITERKQAEEDIQYLSYHDKLTGLYNRAFFEEELKRIDTARQLPISLIIADVNGLKLINDAMGHQEGDRILIKMAQILKKSCRQEDVVARWGGDEFIILLPKCENQVAARIIKKIKDSCRKLDELPILINMSLGAGSKNLPDRAMQEVIVEAEDKMYRHKMLESRSARSSFIISLEKTLWTRSHETKEHCQRMQEIAQRIGRAVELTDSELDNLRLLAALHDIGKIAIPNSILDKAGSLTKEEWEAIKKHPEIGYRIAISSPELAPIAEAILNHHERWDGRGYPLGVKGKKIPLISRIIAIADAYDVMVNGRPYQKTVSEEEALTEIAKCAGTQFDPDLVSKTIEMYTPIKQLH